MKYSRGAAGRMACSLHFWECSGNAGSHCDLSSSDWDVLNRGSTASCFQFPTPVRSLHVVFPAEPPLHKVLPPGSGGGREQTTHYFQPKIHYRSQTSPCRSLLLSSLNLPAVSSCCCCALPPRPPGDSSGTITTNVWT